MKRVISIIIALVLTLTFNVVALADNLTTETSTQFISNNSYAVVYKDQQYKEMTLEEAEKNKFFAETSTMNGIEQYPLANPVAFVFQDGTIVDVNGETVINLADYTEAALLFTDFNGEQYYFIRLARNGSSPSNITDFFKESSLELVEIPSFTIELDGKTYAKSTIDPWVVFSDGTYRDDSGIPLDSGVILNHMNSAGLLKYKNEQIEFWFACGLGDIDPSFTIINGYNEGIIVSAILSNGDIIKGEDLVKDTEGSHEEYFGVSIPVIDSHKDTQEAIFLLYQTADGSCYYTRINMHILAEE